MNWAQDFSGAALLSLTASYRSSGPILELAQAIIQQAPYWRAAKLRPMRPQGPRPVLCETASAQQEAYWVARQVTALLGGLDSRQVEAGNGQGGYAPRDIAVLYRLHAQGGLLAQALRDQGVPVQVAAEQALAELDPMDLRAQRVSLLSMHAAKGLEWPVVFVTGVEQGLLPYQPPGRPPSDLEEERRLLYVACTRAEERLYLSRGKRRTLFGKTTNPGLSPLLSPNTLQHLDRQQPAIRRKRARQMDLF